MNQRNHCNGGSIGWDIILMMNQIKRMSPSAAKVMKAGDGRFDSFFGLPGGLVVR